jgi:hypothetical protein
MLLVTPARASTVDALALEGLTAAADEVFIAEAISESVHRDDRGRIVTDLRLRVAESLAGERSAGEEVVLRCLGGSIDGVGMRVAGEAQLAVGETAVVFARRSDGGWLRAVGMSQGVLPMRPSAEGWWVEPGGAGLTLVRRGSSGRLVPGTAALERATPLAELRRAVIAAGASGPRGTR